MAAAHGGHAGGIVALADLIDAHRGAFEYDWRARFGKPLKVVGRSMPWGEACRLTGELARDTASHVCAALNGWEFPATREALVLMDLYDAYAAVKFKRPQPYPRPWQTGEKSTRQRGNAAGRTPEEVRRILNEHGHNIASLDDYRR